jgi:hypothetical protein
MKLIDVTPTPSNSDKKYIATFCSCKGATKCDPKDRKKIAFGAKGSTTFINGATELQKANYLKRHAVNEDWNSATAGALSRWILWSARTLSEGIANFKKAVKC